MEETFYSTTRKLCEAANNNNLGPAPRLIWLMPEDSGDCPLWEDGKGWLDVRKLKESKELEVVDAVELILADVGDWAREAAHIRARPDRKRHRLNGRELARKLQNEAGLVFTFRLHGSFWGIKLLRRARAWVADRCGKASDDVAQDGVQR